MTTSRSFSVVAAVLLCTVTATAQAPANDDCANATAILVGTTNFDQTGANDSTDSIAGATCGITTIFQDVWFTFNPPTTGNYEFESFDSGFGNTDTKFALYSVTNCPADELNLIDCDDDGGATAFHSKVSASLTAGASVLLRVGTFSATSTTLPTDLVITLLPPPPANDDCANASAAILGLNPFSNVSAVSSGFDQAGATCGFTSEVFSDVWFTFTPAMSTNYDIATVNSTSGPFDTKFTIYDNSTPACPPLVSNIIDCDDDGGPGLQSFMRVSLTAGTQYLIRVGGFGGSTGSMDLEIALTPPPPAEDSCSGALTATVGSNAFDLDLATLDGLALDPGVCDMDPLSTDEGIYNDVWFLFMSPTTGSYDFDTDIGTFFDTRLAVYNQSTCPDVPANVIACDDDTLGTQSFAQANLTMGSTYLVRVGSDSPGVRGAGNLTIVATPPPPTPPANDDCVNATPITAFGLYALDSVLATTDGMDLAGFCDPGTFGDDQIYQDVWYEYTPTVGGCTYISTLGFVTYDSRIAVYTGGCPDDPAMVIACNDDETLPISSPFESGLDVTLVAGQTYLIRVGTFGAFTTASVGMLNISAGPVADANNTTGTPQVGAPGCVPGPAFNEFCFGDGGNQMGCTNCPCGNNAPIGSGGGCLNSSGDGIQLNPSGSTSVSLPSGDTTDLRFGADGAPANAFCILNSGDALAPGSTMSPCFGLNTGAQAAAFDGLRCAIMSTRRHGGRSADANGDVGVTNNPWGGEGGPPVGLAVAGGGFIAGQTRYFQIINRDDALAVCMRGLNTSQAVEVTFTP